MSNLEQLIKNDVKAWNKFREDNSYINISLYGADFRELDLKGVNLKGVNLNRANFKNTKNIPIWINKGLNKNSTYCQELLIDSIKNGFKKLSEAYLINANLNEVDLKEADLSKVYLNRADLRGANLSGADLSGADLSKANFKNTIIDNVNFNNSINFPEWIEKGLDDYGTYSQKKLIDHIKNGYKNLKEANLKEANLRGANLSGADLSGAVLFEADLKEADLKEADLKEANLKEANLKEANLSGAVLFGADLSGANLINTNFTNAYISGVNLYGTARDDWVINFIECDYFFYDSEGKIRIPKEESLKKGQFEELYKQLPTFEYIFKNGFTPIDAFIMDQVVQAINEKKPDIELKLDSFHSRGQPRAVFTLVNKHDVEETRKQVACEYESKIIALEGKNEVLKELVLSFINKPQQIIQGSNITIGDNKMGDNISFSGNGNVAFGKDNSKVKQTNIEYAENNKLLTEIDKLKKEVSKLNIDQTNREAIDIQFEALESSAKSDKKNAVLMKSTLESIKTITQGALGSAMGAGLIETFKRVGMMII